MEHLHENLMALCQDTDPDSDAAFYFVDKELDGTKFRTFNYRLAKYTDFTKPNALNCRGTTFCLPEGKAPILSSLPFAKFFNLDENPFTMNLKHSQIMEVAEKRDGSLISTYQYGDKYGLKSKTSLDSEHAKLAWEVYTSEEYRGLKEEVGDLVFTGKGYTVNFELTTPNPRLKVVIGYPKTELKIIGVRRHKDGALLSRDHFDHRGFPELNRYWVETRVLEGDKSAFVEAISGLTDIEGFVLKYPDQLVKVKTDWYRSLHMAKESIDIPSRLFDCIVDESIDDLRVLFKDDPFQLAKIQALEDKVVPMYNAFVKQVDCFVEENKELERKDFAIKGQEILPKYLFSLAMMKYLGKPIDFKGWAKKNVEVFGIGDGK